MRVEAVTEPDGDYDFALIAVKSPHHRAALEPLVGRIGAFVTLGNGLIQDRIAEIVGADELLACLVEWAGTNVGPGRLIRDTVGAMVAGELDGEVRPRTRLLAQCLATVGEARISRNIRGQIWSKLLVNSTFTGLSAVSGLRYGGVAEHSPEAVFGLWREGLAVAARRGRGARADPGDRAARAGGRRARKRRSSA